MVGSHMLILLLGCATPAEAPVAAIPVSPPSVPAAPAPSLGSLDYRDKRVELYAGGAWEVHDATGALVARGDSPATLERYDATLAGQVSTWAGLDASLGYRE